MEFYPLKGQGTACPARRYEALCQVPKGQGRVTWMLRFRAEVHPPPMLLRTLFPTEGEAETSD